MPWLRVNQIRLSAPSAVPTPLFTLEVHRAAMPGHPGASRGESRGSGGDDIGGSCWTISADGWAGNRLTLTEHQPLVKELGRCQRQREPAAPLDGLDAIGRVEARRLRS